MSLVFSLIAIVASAHLCGWLCEKAGQPALFGHMLAGLLWGPFALDAIPAVGALGRASDISVLVVVTSAGLGMRLSEVRDVFRGAGVLALLPAFLVPAAAGVLFAWAAGQPLRAAIVVGLCVSVTALPVALRILDRAGMLRTRIAAVAISSALLGDIAVLLALIVAGAGGAVGVPYPVVLFVVALALSDAVERSAWVRRLRDGLAVVTSALFAPYFLAYQSLQLAPDGLPGTGFIAALIVLATLTKLLGGYATGLASGLDRRDAMGVAVVMNARGLMEMVIANIAFRAGLVTAPVFAALLVMGAVTTMITPPLLTWWQRKADATRAGARERDPARER